MTPVVTKRFGARTAAAFAAAALCVAASGMPSTGAAAATEVDARLDQLFGSHLPFQNFLAALKAAAAANDDALLASMTAYPLQVRRGGNVVLRIRDAAQLREKSGAVFSPAVLQAITRQRYDALFANQQGAMVGSGELWFGYTCLRVTCARKAMKITAINLP